MIDTNPWIVISISEESVLDDSDYFIEGISCKIRFLLACLNHFLDSRTESITSFIYSIEDKKSDYLSCKQTIWTINILTLAASLFFLLGKRT
jgi:hypothetical protein